MEKIEAFGKIHKGELVIFDEELFQEEINEIGFVNHFHMTVEYGNKRTLDQNAYLWGAVVKAIRLRLKQEGYKFTPGECYQWLENKFCKMEDYNHKTGEIFTKITPLKELSTSQFDEIVVGDIRQYAQDVLDVYIKLPHEYYQLTPSAYEKFKAGEITLSKAREITKEDEVYQLTGM